MAVSEDLELNIAPAVEAVEQLGQTIEATLTNAFASVGQTAQDVFATLGGDIQVEPDVSGVAGAISDAIDAADTTVTLEPTGSETIPADIANAIALADTDVPLVADGDLITAAIEDGIGAADTVVPLEAELDTTGVQEGIGGVSEAIGGLNVNLDSFTGGALAANAAGGLLSGSFGQVGAAAKAMGPEIAAGAAAGTALVGTWKTLFDAALPAAAATERFNRTLGDLADQVEHLDMGGLNTTIKDLALSLGSDDDQLRQVAASMFQLATTAGIARRSAAQFTEQVVTLAARAVALNPALGDVATVAQGMGVALARGGRFANRYQIDLNAAAIATKAMEQTGKSSAAELTNLEKSIAGADLAFQKYGTNVSAAVEAGITNPAIQLAAFRQAFQETVEALGAPLVSPTLAFLTSIAPEMQELGEVTAELATEALPILEAGFRLSADSAKVLLFTAQSLVKVEKVVIDQTKGFLDLIGKVPGAVKGFVNSVGGFLDDLLPDIGPIDDVIKGLASSITGAGEEVAGSTAAVKESSKQLGVLAGSAGLAKEEHEGLATAALATGSAFDVAIRGVSNFTADALRAGLDAGELTRFQTETQKAIDGIVKAFTSKLPTAAQATTEAVGNAIEATALRTEAAARRFGLGADDIAAALNKVKGTFNLKDVTADLEQQAKNIEGFFANMEIIATKHLDDTFAALAELGPVAGGKLAEELAKAGPAEQLQLEARLQRIKTANDDGERLFRDAAVSLPTLAQQAATAVNRAFGIMDLPGVISSQTLLAAQKLADINSDRASSPKAIASRGGLEIGISTAAGIATGIRGGQQGVNKALTAVINEAIRVTKKALGVSSPSKVFAELGEQIMDGLVIGVEDGATSFDAALAQALDVSHLVIPKIEVPATIVPQVAEDVELPAVQLPVQPAAAAPVVSPSARVPTQVATAVSGGDTFTINAYYPTPEPISDLAPRALKRAQYTLGTVRNTNN